MNNIPLVKMAREIVRMVDGCKKDGGYSDDVISYVTDMAWMICQLCDKFIDLHTVMENMIIENKLLMRQLKNNVEIIDNV